MQQILFEIPLKTWFGVFYDIPVHGYGFMLFLAFIATTQLAVYLSKRQGIPPEVIQDLAIFLFVFGILGARVTYVIQFWHKYQDKIWNVFAIWDGGLVFYGSAIGGFLGFVAAYFYILKKRNINFWKMADVVAPCLALGLALGRIGCLLNGCCYGGVACEDCFAIHFPLPSEPRYVMVRKGYQTAAGFTLDVDQKPRVIYVKDVYKDLGFQVGDVVVKIGDTPVKTIADILEAEKDWGMDNGYWHVRSSASGKELKLPIPRDKFYSIVSFLSAMNIGEPFIDKVEPNSPAHKSGVRDGDRILSVEGTSVKSLGDLVRKLSSGEDGWQRGDNDLELKVQHVNNDTKEYGFVPRTIGMHPTQIYETISTVLILCFLLSYLPFRRHNGELFILMMILYSIHRFTNEIIRIDTKPEGGGLTLSQSISVGVLFVGIGLGVWKWQQPPEYGPDVPEQPPSEPEPTQDKDIPETAVQD